MWCPDWPVVAAGAHQGLSSELPLAVFERGEVFACSATARVEGVRRGMRRRDASARCPELIVLDRNEASEIRTFENVLAAIEEISAGVAPVRPGLCALRVPSRFYGGESEAAAVVAEHLVGAGVWDFRMGIADGIFAAEHAARRAAPQDCWIIPHGGSAVFLAGLSIGVLENAELVTLLRRLGIRSLGDFAAVGLPAMSSPASVRKAPYFTDERAEWTIARSSPAGRLWIWTNMCRSCQHWRRLNRSCSALGRPRNGWLPSLPIMAWSVPRFVSRL